MAEAVIIGGGFAGLAAARRLTRARRGIRVTLVDRKPTFDFLPLLPDIAGGRIPAGAASAPLAGLARRAGFAFRQDAIEGIDAARGRAIGQVGSYPYDALLLACGSEPDFYGSRQFREHAARLHSCGDAERLSAALAEPRLGACLVAGGGYTGLETATHLRRRFARERRPVRIIVVEAGPALLGGLPDWMRRYARDNLARLDIEVRENCRIADLAPRAVALSDGSRYEPAMAIWCAGVRAAGLTQRLPAAAGPRGRIPVSAALEADGLPGLFAAGDAAAWMGPGGPLRLSVQAARMQGERAADNLVRRLRGRPLRAYRPRDPGFVLPMANGRSCGVAAGLRLRGCLPTAAHYGLCLLYLPGARRKGALLRALTMSEPAVSQTAIREEP